MHFWTFYRSNFSFILSHWILSHEMDVWWTYSKRNKWLNTTYEGELKSFLANPDRIQILLKILSHYIVSTNICLAVDNIKFYQTITIWQAVKYAKVLQFTITEPVEISDLTWARWFIPWIFFYVQDYNIYCVFWTWSQEQRR